VFYSAVLLTDEYAATQIGGRMKLNAATARVLHSVTALIKPTALPARVLVVDDEDGVRRFVTRVLHKAGYVVQMAAGGTEALDAINHGVFDLIVTDVRMPDMSGPKFVEQARRNNADAKVLYLTGYNDQLFDERGTLWVNEAFLDKPCTENGLLESVALLLTGHIGPTSAMATAPMLSTRGAR